jgi:hypothetical protein
MAINTNKIKADTINIQRESILIKCSSARIIDLFDEGILFMEDSPQKRYSANSTTMAIWDLIDGSRTSKEIAQEITSVGEVNVIEIEDDIYELLASLRKLGFVEEVRETTNGIH